MGRTGKLGGFHLNISEVLQMASSPPCIREAKHINGKRCNDKTMFLSSGSSGSLPSGAEAAWGVHGLRCLDWLGQQTMQQTTLRRAELC